MDRKQTSHNKQTWRAQKERCVREEVRDGGGREGGREGGRGRKGGAREGGKGGGEGGRKGGERERGIEREKQRTKESGRNMKQIKKSGTVVRLRRYSEHHPENSGRVTPPPTQAQETHRPTQSKRTTMR